MKEITIYDLAFTENEGCHMSFLMNDPLGRKTFENLPEQIKNKTLANFL